MISSIDPNNAPFIVALHAVANAARSSPDSTTFAQALGFKAVSGVSAGRLAVKFSGVHDDPDLRGKTKFVQKLSEGRNLVWQIGPDVKLGQPGMPWPTMRALAYVLGSLPLPCLYKERRGCDFQQAFVTNENRVLLSGSTDAPRIDTRDSLAKLMTDSPSRSVLWAQVARNEYLEQTLTRSGYHQSFAVSSSGNPVSCSKHGTVGLRHAAVDHRIFSNVGCAFQVDPTMMKVLFGSAKAWAEGTRGAYDKPAMVRPDGKYMTTKVSVDIWPTSGFSDTRNPGVQLCDLAGIDYDVDVPGRAPNDDLFDALSALHHHVASGPSYTVSTPSTVLASRFTGRYFNTVVDDWSALPVAVPNDVHPSPVTTGPVTGMNPQWMATNSAVRAFFGLPSVATSVPVSDSATTSVETISQPGEKMPMKFDPAKVAAPFAGMPEFHDALVEMLTSKPVKFGELDAATLESCVSGDRVDLVKLLKHVEMVVLFAEVADDKDRYFMSRKGNPLQVPPGADESAVGDSDTYELVASKSKAAFCALVPGFEGQEECFFAVTNSPEIDGTVVGWYHSWLCANGTRRSEMMNRDEHTPGARAFTWAIDNLDGGVLMDVAMFKTYVMSSLARIRQEISAGTGSVSEDKASASVVRTPPVSPKVGGVVGMERETAALHSAMVAGKPAMLVGPTGCGKTFLVRQYHKWDNERRKEAGLPEKPLVIHTFHQESSPTEIVGKATLANGNVVWQDSEFMKLFESGGTYFADEFNFAPGGAHAPLFAALNGDPEIHVPEAGKTYVRSPDFRFVAACNPASKYAGRQPVDKALASRFFVAVEFGYLRPKEEKELIVSRIPGIVSEEAEKVVSFASAMRKAEAEGRVFVPFGTRDALHVAELLVAGYSWDDAVKFGFSGKSDNEDQAAEILRVAKAELPKVSFAGDAEFLKKISDLEKENKALKVECSSNRMGMLNAEKKLKSIKDSISI